MRDQHQRGRARRTATIRNRSHSGRTTAADADRGNGRPARDHSVAYGRMRAQVGKAAQAHAPRQPQPSCVLPCRAQERSLERLEDALRLGEETRDTPAAACAPQTHRSRPPAAGSANKIEPVRPPGVTREDRRAGAASDARRSRDPQAANISSNTQRSVKTVGPASISRRRPQLRILPPGARAPLRPRSPRSPRAASSAAATSPPIPAPMTIVSVCAIATGCPCVDAAAVAVQFLDT